MTKKVFECDRECSSCGGTGLYVGLAERDGAAVVCHTCNGTGKEHVRISYVEFTKRKKKTGVSRVYQVNPGIMISSNSVRNIQLTDFGGMPYKDWSTGKPFPPKSEDRAHTCPCWWWQSADYKRKPSWKTCIGCGSFSDCSSFPTKEKCWERFDREKL